MTVNLGVFVLVARSYMYKPEDLTPVSGTSSGAVAPPNLRLQDREERDRANSTDIAF